MASGPAGRYPPGTTKGTQIIGYKERPKIILILLNIKHRNVTGSVAEPEPTGAAIFEAAPEPEPIFW